MADQLDERKNEVTFQGGPLTLLGRMPEVGSMAPEFTVRTNLGPDSAYGRDTDRGKVRILNVVPSLDTPVCAAQTRRFNQEASKMPGVKVVTISMDLPVAQQRWCAAEGVNNVTCASDYFDGSFGRAFGLRIKELGLLSRAVFVLDGDGKIRYSQLVPEIAQEPEYEPVLSAVKEIA